MLVGLGASGAIPDLESSTRPRRRATPAAPRIPPSAAREIRHLAALFERHPAAGPKPRSFLRGTSRRMPAVGRYCDP